MGIGQVNPDVQRCVVSRGDAVKGDDSGSYVVFTEQASFA